MFKTFKFILILIFLIGNFSILKSQSGWPSKTWANATNLSAILPSSVSELSGLYWNNDLKRLLAIGDAGFYVALQYNSTTSQFSLLGSVANSDGPEGITQVNTSGNEFYSIDENSYEIRKYTFNSSFTTVTKLNSWNLLAAPSPMTNTGNTGTEGIAFVPDSYLQKIGFISSVTGQVYTSTKNMGGLIFIAHQSGGYVWVFDVNPTVNNDFIYVGKYKTNRTESCDLAFDNSTGLLYVLHNVDDNYLEVTDLKTTIVGGEYKLNKINEYFIPNPTSGSSNIEGFAISPKFPQVSSLGVWLCRDVTSTSEKADALKWFTPFTSDGSDIRTDLKIDRDAWEAFSITPNIVHDILKINCLNSDITSFKIQILSITGELVIQKDKLYNSENIDLKSLNDGVYIVKILSNNKINTVKRIIKMD